MTNRQTFFLSSLPPVRVAEAVEQILALGGVGREKAMGATVC